jgi:hypothetical protein
MKTRIIHTKFWRDNYITTLSQIEKLAFLYFISNECVGLLPAYELPDRVIQMDLNLKDLEEVNQIKHKFETDNKIKFLNGYVIVTNMIKYQSYLDGNDRQFNALMSELSYLPECVIEVVGNLLLTSQQLDINRKVKYKILNTKNKEEIEKENRRDERRKYLSSKFGWKLGNISDESENV